MNRRREEREERDKKREARREEESEERRREERTRRREETGGRREESERRGADLLLESLPNRARDHPSPHSISNDSHARMYYASRFWGLWALGVNFLLGHWLYYHIITS